MSAVKIDIEYWEGGDSFRPFIVLRASPKWPSENIAYYRSSGRSNDDADKNKYRKNTWFPTLGLLREGTTLYEELKRNESSDTKGSLYSDGYILKRSVFTDIFDSQMSNWFRAIFNKFEFVPKYKIYGAVPLFLKEKHEIKDGEIPDMTNRIKDAITVLSAYCFTWWQVQLSAQCGGGLWELLPEFRQFVLMYDYDDYTSKPNYEFVVRSTPLPEYTIDAGSGDKMRYPKANADTVNQYLLYHDALIYGFMLVDYRENKVALKKHFVLGIPSPKVSPPNVSLPNISPPNVSLPKVLSPPKTTTRKRKRIPSPDTNRNTKRPRIAGSRRRMKTRRHK